MARKWLRLSGWQRQQTRCVRAERLEEGLDEREKRQRPGASRRRPWRCGAPGGVGSASRLAPGGCLPVSQQVGFLGGAWHLLWLGWRLGERRGAQLGVLTRSLSHQAPRTLPDSLMLYLLPLLSPLGRLISMRAPSLVLDPS